MVRVKVSEATGPVLDWMVAWCEDQASPADLSSAEVLLYRSQATNAWMYPKMRGIAYSTNWAQGGQIIEREGISIYRMTSDWSAAYNPSGAAQDGPTPLIAAMRCYVASKLGNEIEVPEELS